MSDLETRLNSPFKLNFRGHNLQPTRFVQSTELKDYFGKVVDSVRGLRLSDEIEKELGRRTSDRDALDIYGHLGHCHVCSEEIKFVPVEGKPEHYHIPNRCKYPKGIPSFDVMLNVPSGKIVFTNDCRDIFDVSDSNIDCNTRMGTVQIVKAYEKAGILPRRQLLPQHLQDARWQAARGDVWQRQRWTPGGFGLHRPLVGVRRGLRPVRPAA
jgi:hypothetical protein